MMYLGQAESELINAKENDSGFIEEIDLDFENPPTVEIGIPSLFRVTMPITSKQRLETTIWLGLASAVAAAGLAAILGRKFLL